jgi:NAD(P)-dependent dehydrogenase (short-subunit alcohol dehydrogenase family)
MSRVILITGASSGFGNGLARALAARGDHVYATMRAPDGHNRAKADELRAFADTHDHALAVLDLDVRKSASVDAAVRHIVEREGRIDIAVNNAGVAPFGLSECYAPEQLAEIFDINVIGCQRVMRAVLPLMIEQRAGLILHTSTVLARTTLPCAGVYAGSKAALESLVESYHHELAGTGVGVAMVEPGAHPTEVASKGPFPRDLDRAAKYGARAGLLDQLKAGFYRVFTGPLAPDVADVVAAMQRLCDAPPAERPLRLVVDKMHHELVEATNRARDAARADYIRRSGGVEP